MPSTLTIQVQIPLKHRVFSVNFCLNRTKINKKRPRLAHFFQKSCVHTCVRVDKAVAKCDFSVYAKEERWPKVSVTRGRYKKKPKFCPNVSTAVFTDK